MIKRSIYLVWLLALVSPAALAQPSPAQQKIALAQAAIEKHHDKPDGYNDLALAQARRARETSDPAYYDHALAALARSLELAPENFAARRNRVWVLLGKHEFAQALGEAQVLNKAMPDDLIVYAYLTDANVELGRYAEAEQSAQWLLNLRPGAIPGLTRAAYLRELFGDVEGAIELMQMAYERTAPSETEDRAWALTQLGHLHLTAGRPLPAEAALQGALRLFPDYHYALAQLARLRSMQGRFSEALELRRRHYAAAPHAENLFSLAEALLQAGHAREARAAFAEFERKARAERMGWDNANRELIAYYADYANRPDRALEVARLEYGRRRDVHTLDAYAWALYRSRQFSQAREAIESALAVGVRDAQLYRHAGAIAQSQGDRRAARRYLKMAREIEPHAAVATIGHHRARARLG